MQVVSERERCSRESSDATASLAKQYRGFTNITHGTVAVLAVAAFITSLIFIIKLRDASTAALDAIGVSRATRSSLRELLGTNLFFAIVALLATLAVVILGGARPDNPHERVKPGFKSAARKKLGLKDESHVGWLCKVLNAVALLSAFAVAVTAAAAAAFYTAPTAVP